MLHVTLHYMLYVTLLHVTCNPLSMLSVTTYCYMLHVVTCYCPNICYLHELDQAP